MLVILYGPIGEMGRESRLYFESRGFKTVEKLYSTNNPQLTPMFTARQYISEEEFLARTDSLFRYEVGGIRVGCNQEQIADAVYGAGNYLLTLAANADGFDMLEQIKQQQGNIKQAYENNVCLIYTYIDNASLRNIVKNYPPEERQMRMAIGRAIRENYLAHQDLFDYVVIYGGKRSQFNLESLHHQYATILDARMQRETTVLRYGEVFVAAAPRDGALAEGLCGHLREKGVAVFDHRQLPADDGYVPDAIDAIRHAKIVVPVISGWTEDTWQEEMLQLVATATNHGCLLLPLVMGSSSLAASPLAEVLTNSPQCFYLTNDGSWKLADRLSRLLRDEKKMKQYATQAEEYSRLRMWEQAYHWQMLHLEVCRSAVMTDPIGLHYYGGVGFVEESAGKLARMMIKMQRPLEAVDDLLYPTMQDLYDDTAMPESPLMDEIFWCYAAADLSGEEVYARLCAMLFPHLLRGDGWNEHDGLIVESLMMDYDSAKRRWDAEQVAAAAQAEESVSDDEVEIASNGEKAIELFESVLTPHGDTPTRHDLIEGYRRIRDYCAQLPMSDEVAKVAATCMDNLRRLEEQRDAPHGGTIDKNKMLKAYLGKPLPNSGEFDVFLSFKSADMSLATTIYDFLTNSGKVVFFSEVTLPKMGESVFKDSIAYAIQHAKHMVLVGSDPNYFKTEWVHYEWSTYQKEAMSGKKNGQLIMVLTDDAAVNHQDLPQELKAYQFIKMSEYRERLLSYLR